MRPFVVVFGAEGIEPTLLCGEGYGRWSCGLCLECQVHALVPTVLLRLAGLDVLRLDAQLDEPYREAAERPFSRRAKRRALVGTERPRHPRGPQRPRHDPCGPRPPIAGRR